MVPTASPPDNGHTALSARSPAAGSLWRRDKSECGPGFGEGLPVVHDENDHFPVERLP